MLLQILAITSLSLSPPVPTGPRALPIGFVDSAHVIPATASDTIRKRRKAIALSCPHQNTALRWNDAAARFQCPKHHSQYTPEGVFITGRATRNMDRLSIRRDPANNIVVDPDTVYQSDDNPTEWASAVIKL
ncbi:MAG TPA: Rieske 2Fe-2S domain-containing protein [Gemmatimonadaceae bacterium]|jgi:Rieske Fe-S protein|nr:Rieske 2Fe-2S domain-containing protein [Gemmatimonadaceae bacterium]